MKSSNPIVNRALAYVGQRRADNAAAKVGDMVVYGGGPHVVVKDLGGGKYVLRSRSTGRSFAVTAPKGFDVLEPGSYALNRGNTCGK